jgi:NAD(P)-dependent dehydrogenase (short-subunit alcohol dehydrogenase family)
MTSAGKTVIITGAARGIGRYVARTFAKAGANVVVADIAPMNTVVQEIQELGAQPLAVTTDVTDEDSVRRLFETAYQRYSRIDTLINNAAIVTQFYTGKPRWPKIRDMPQDKFARVMNTNLLGTFLCCKHAIPYMESLYAGHIINFGQGSLAPRNIPYSLYAGNCIYSVSKIAIRAFTRDLADEEREFNICVMSMAPSFPRRAELGRGIVTEDSPEWCRDPDRDVANIGDNFVVAADASMEFSGKQVAVRDGILVAVSPDEPV